jgi:hypothetical protein
MAIKLEEVFSGKTVGTGELVLFNGKFKLGVTSAYSGRWDAQKNTLVLEEFLEFSNGKNLELIWRYVKTAPDQWQGYCPGDVPEDAHGRIVGNRVTFNYLFFVPIMGPVRLPLQCEDTIAHETGGALMQTIRMTAFGAFPFGEMRLSIRKG